MLSDANTFSNTLTVLGSAGLSITDNVTSGTQMLRVGDDSFFTDVDTANTVGLFGRQDSTTGSLQLGSGGVIITGSSGTLTVAGNISVNNTSLLTGLVTASAGILSNGLVTASTGFLSQASSTIGNGVQTGGLTISGGATTTGNTYLPELVNLLEIFL